MRCSTDLLEIADAGNFLGGGFSLSEDGEKDCGENRDDCDDDEQFDKGEGFFHLVLCSEGQVSLDLFDHYNTNKVQFVYIHGVPGVI